MDFMLVQFMLVFIIIIRSGRTMKVAISGATGYSGAELVRILQRHPNVSIHSTHASSSLGEPLSNSYPHMETIVNENLEAVDVQKIADEVDIVFTATPT